jgi:hypothetical protein
MTVIYALRSTDSEPGLAEFEHHLEAAMSGGIISCGAWNAEVQCALDAVRAAAPNPPKQLLDDAMDAFLRQAADPRPWWDQAD